MITSSYFGGFIGDLPVNPPWDGNDAPDADPTPETVPTVNPDKPGLHWLRSTRDGEKWLVYWTPYLPEEHAEHGAGMWYSQDVDVVHKFTAAEMAAHWFVYHSPVIEPQD